MFLSVHLGGLPPPPPYQKAGYATDGGKFYVKFSCEIMKITVLIVVIIIIVLCKLTRHCLIALLSSIIMSVLVLDLLISI